MANSHVRYAFGPKWIALPRITIFAPAAVLSLDMTTLPCPMPSFAKSGKRRDAHFSSRKTIDHDLLRLFSMRSEEPYRSVARGCSLFSLLESSAYGHPCRSMALASIQLCSDGSLRGEVMPEMCKFSEIVASNERKQLPKEPSVPFHDIFMACLGNCLFYGLISVIVGCIFLLLMLFGMLLIIAAKMLWLIR